VVGVSPNPEKADEFLSRLAGMAKYAINNKGGRVSIKALASTMAVRESAVRIGLEWLAAGGHVSIVPEEDALILSAGNDEANQYLQKELYVAVNGILEETAAYRMHFARADVHNLIEELAQRSVDREQSPVNIDRPASSM
jgi:Mn-dependent DtxR family transcriptional regulator